MAKIRDEMTLGPRTREIVRYRFDNPNLSQKQIALHFNVGQQRVSQILKSKRVLAAYPMLARAVVRSMVPEAVNRFHDLMLQKDNLEVSRKVTERVLSDQKVLDSPEIHVKSTLEIKTINELQQIVKDAASLPEPSIDAEIVTDVDSDVNK